MTQQGRGMKGASPAATGAVAVAAARAEARSLAAVPAHAAHFQAFEARLDGARQKPVHALRREAIAAFEAAGFPTTKDEEWRHTNVAPLEKVAWRPAAPGAEGCPDCAAEIQGSLAPLYFGDWAKARLVLVNGRVSPGLSNAAAASLPAGVVVTGLAEALDRHRALVEPHLAKHARFAERGFVALNTAFIEDGAFVYVPRGVVVDTPIAIVHATFAPEATVVHPRTLVVVEEQGQATVIEVFVGRENDVYFTNAVAEVVVGAGATAHHAKLELEGPRAFHIATTHSVSGRSSGYTSHSVAEGGLLVRNDLNAVFDGEGCDYTLDGLYILAGKQHVDNHTLVDHAKPHCGGREVYRGILAGQSSGVFNGRIIVRPGAQKTDAKQTNKNLLLSDEAQVETKPQLEIYANDVKCTHGATVGRLDADALFYLRARGIGEAAARSMLTYAFASEVVARLPVEPVRAALEASILARFGSPSASVR
jgi:Fe-S cluster assembly protein SufD